MPGNHCLLISPSNKSLQIQEMEYIRIPKNQSQKTPTHNMNLKNHKAKITR
jgi:hypothetical protein